MFYRQFIQEVHRGETKPFYFLFGADDFLLKEGLRVLKAAYLASGGDVEFVGEGESVKKVLLRARGGDIFSPRKVLVWRDPPFLKDKSPAAEEKLLLEYAKKTVEDVCLVLFAPGVDRRRTFYKTLAREKLVYDFNPLKGRELADWVRERARLLGKSLPQPVLEYLLLCTGENMARLAGELEKVALYLGEEKEIRQETVELLVNCSFNVSIFSLVDLLGAKKKDRGLFLLKEMLAQGEPPLKILFMISRQLQLLYRLKALEMEGLPPRELPRQLALAPFVVEKLTRQAGMFQQEELAGALKLVRAMDYAIKTGRKAPDLALELLLWKI